MRRSGLREADNLNDYLTAYGTNLSRLKQLYGLLYNSGPEIKALLGEVDSSNATDIDDLLPQLRALRELFIKKSETIALKLSEDHPVMMPFGILGELSIAQLHETVHTKMLAWLLDPKKSHGFGTTFLQALLSESGAELSHLTEVQVRTEYTLSSGLGRLDIFVFGKGCDPKQTVDWGLWIEIKSKQTTQEGANQLKRYEHHRSGWSYSTGGQDYGIFLTPDGRLPKSTDGIGLWKAISHINLIQILWREAENLHPKPLGLEWLRLYLSSVAKEYTGINTNSLEAIPYHQLIELEKTNLCH